MVKISPKDSGPIDTRNGDCCDNCTNGVRVKGGKVWKKDSRVHSGTKYHGVCPYCREGISNPRITTVVKCEDCTHIMTALIADNGCANCGEELTENNATVLSE